MTKTTLHLVTYPETGMPARPRLRIEYPNGRVVDLLPHIYWEFDDAVKGEPVYVFNEGGDWKAKRLKSTRLIKGMWVLPAEAGQPRRVASTQTLTLMMERQGCRVRVLEDVLADLSDLRTRKEKLETPRTILQRIRKQNLERQRKAS